MNQRSSASHQSSPLSRRLPILRLSFLGNEPPPDREMATYLFSPLDPRSPFFPSHAHTSLSNCGKVDGSLIRSASSLPSRKSFFGCFFSEIDYPTGFVPFHLSAITIDIVSGHAEPSLFSPPLPESPIFRILPSLRHPAYYRKNGINGLPSDSGIPPFLLLSRPFFLNPCWLFFFRLLASCE